METHLSIDGLADYLKIYERLQGYPDGWTEYGHKGEPISDNQRY